MIPKQKLLQIASRGWDGRDWYAEGLANIDSHCTPRGWDTRKFVTTLAVLSPQVSVPQNVALAVKWWARGTPPNVIRSVRVGFNRLRRAGYCVSAIRGPKTRRFAEALLGDSDAVVLDTHMGAVLGVPAAKLGNKSVREEAGRRIRWVARQLDVSPRDAQALIWTRQRELAGYQYSAIDLGPVLHRLKL